MATLYEIEQSILDCIDLETGEIIDTERLEHLEMQREKKIESVALWYRNLLSDAEQYKAEKDRFAALEKAAKNKAESLKNYLNNSLQGGTFKSSKINITYRKSESVVVTDLYSIPDEFVNYLEPMPDKTMIKKLLKSGSQIMGVQLVESTNIQIK